MTLFYPKKQTTVWDIQTTIRQIDMSLYPNIKGTIGTDQTFVYSTLAGCCALIGSKNLSRFSQEIQTFANEIIRPVVDECLKEIKNFNCELNNTQLKLLLLKKIDRIQFYPEIIDFRKIQNEKMVAELQKVIKVGVYTLYKVNPSSDKFYGGRIDISEGSFSQAAQILEKYGYKQEGDIIGSSVDRQGHITTIEPRELAQNYDSVVSAHESFIKISNKVALKPTCIRVGSPQSGRMSRIVTIAVEVDGLDKYRSILGAMKFPPHLSIFSQEIQPISILKNISFDTFTRDNGNNYLMRLNECLNGGLPQKKEIQKRQINWNLTAVVIGVFAVVSGLLLYKKATA